MNPAHWPLWWDMLCAGVGGFVVGVLVTAKIAIVAIRGMGAREAAAQLKKGGNLDP